VKGQRGFSMLELLIALAILGAMLAILFSGLSVGLRAWSRGEDTTQATQHARSLNHVLEQALMGIHPYQAPLDAGAQRTLLFQGDVDRVAFVTVAPPVPLAPGVAYTAVLLSVRAEEANVEPAFVIQERALPNWQPFDEAQPVLVDPTTTAVRFRYQRDTGGAWEETWDAATERALPRGIEVTVTARVNGATVELPPITVPIRAVAP
jgi:general secretion pathway protein J